MRPTRIWVLVLVAVIVGAGTYALTHAQYDAMPTPPVYAPVWIALFALAEAYTAYTTRARLAGRPRTRPIHPITVARIAALAKASSLAGAIVGGGYAGFLAYVAARSEAPKPAHDARIAAFAVGAVLLLVVAALLLEHVCRVPTPPKPPPDSPEGEGQPSQRQ
jgi:MFS family permease